MPSSGCGNSQSSGRGKLQSSGCRKGQSSGSGMAQSSGSEKSQSSGNRKSLASGNGKSQAGGSGKPESKLPLSEKLARLKEKMREDGSLDAMIEKDKEKDATRQEKQTLENSIKTSTDEVKEIHKCYKCLACSVQFHFGGCHGCEVNIMSNISIFLEPICVCAHARWAHMYHM